MTNLKIQEWKRKTSEKERKKQPSMTSLTKVLVDRMLWSMWDQAGSVKREGREEEEELLAREKRAKR